MSGKNKKVLIVSSFCYENASANGICARALYDGFLEKGCQTHMLGIGDGKDLSETQHTVPDTSGKKLRFGRVSAAVKLVKSFFTPTQDAVKVKRYYKKIKQLHEQYQFDLIIAMFFPLELVSAVAKLKKRSNDFDFVIYELDSVADGIGGNKNSFAKKLSVASSIRWCRKNYSLADLVCVLKAHEAHAEQIYGKAFGKKMRIVDLPLLHDNILPCTAADRGQVNFVYSGELNTRYRPPHKLLEVLEMSRDLADWNLHFYSKGDCEDLLKAHAAADPRIHRHGYVSQEVLHKQYEVTDFFVSIGNTHSNSVPSKIINYISFGKPIIHFCLQDNDICEEYLNKYPLALSIKKGESAQSAAKRIREFVAQTQGCTIGFDGLCNAFPMNLPSFSVDVMTDDLWSEGIH